MITLVLVLRHSFENCSIGIKVKQDNTCDNEFEAPKKPLRTKAIGVFSVQSILKEWFCQRCIMPSEHTNSLISISFLC